MFKRDRYANRRQSRHIHIGTRHRSAEYPAHGAAVQGAQRPEKCGARDHSRLIRRDRHGRRQAEPIRAAEGHAHEAGCGRDWAV